MKNLSRRISILTVGFAGLMFTGTALAGSLTLYTSQPDADAARTVEEFRKLNPDVDVQVYRSGTSDIMSKLAAEFSAGAPQADVLLIADAVSMESLKADNRLMQFSEASVDGFEPGSVDPEKYYFGSKLITTGIAYNSAAEQKPQHWADLEKPEYKGMVVMPSPLYSGAAAFLLSGFVASDSLGWKFFDSLKANEVVSVRGNGAVLKSIASGEKPYGVLVDFMALNAKAKGSPIEFVFPQEGVPAVTEPVAIMSTTANAQDAKKFIRFILSDAGQELALKQGYLPAKTSVGKPAWLPDGLNVKIMPIDTQKVLKNTDADKSRFTEMFGG